MKKLVMIGCGEIGKYHLSHFMEFGDLVELAGFCDLIPERAQEFVDKSGSGKAFTDFKEMYDEIEPDMVFICVPPYAHGEIEYETIQRKLPFFVEKPLTLDMELAKDIAAKVAENGLITAVGFQCRYDGLVKPLADFSKENEVAYINLTRSGSVPTAPWWTDKKLSGGQLTEQTIHNLDYIRYTFGEPDTVFSMATRGFVKEFQNYDTDDLTATVVRFKSGALATVATGCYATAGTAYDSKLTYSTRDKRADLYLLDRLDVYGEAEQKEKIGDLVIEGDGSLSNAAGEAETFRNEGDPGILCDKTFIEAVISGDGSKIRSPYADALKTLAFALACNESMDTGLPVKVEL